MVLATAADRPTPPSAKMGLGHIRIVGTEIEPIPTALLFSEEDCGTLTLAEQLGKLGGDNPARTASLSRVPKT
jgi:hypothetical protein